MTLDDRRRLLERSNDPLARARILVERIRTGDLRPERLRVAAEAGDVDARRALGWPDGPDLRERLSRWIPSTGPKGPGWGRVVGPVPWVRFLAELDREAGLRAAQAASHATLVHTCTLGRRARFRDSLELDEAREITDAVGAWIADRRPELLALVRAPEAGSLLTFWRVLSNTARHWDDGVHYGKPPTGARTVERCLEWLREVGCQGPSAVVLDPIGEEVSRWALRSETTRISP